MLTSRVYCAIFKMTKIHEQRINMKCAKLSKSFKTHQVLQNAYGNQCLLRTQCYGWLKRFKDGQESVDDNPRSGVCRWYFLTT